MLQKERYLIKENISAHQALTKNNFRPARVGIIVAARLKSSRLMKKALLPIAGRASVERCLDQCLAVKGVEEVILATSNLEEDSVLSDYLSEDRAEFWVGDPDDVLFAILGLRFYNLDIVVRVHSRLSACLTRNYRDSLASHILTGADYIAADAAVGTSGEIINVSAMRKVIAHFGRAEHSEYMTWYFQNNPEIFQLI